MSSATVAPFEPPSSSEKTTSIPEFKRRRPRFWLHSLSWLTIVFFIAVSAGALLSHYNDDDGEGRDDIDSYEWPVQVFGFVVPSLVLFVVTLVALDVGARRLGMDVVAEAADGNGMKDACIATWTNMSVVSALVLSVALPVVLVDPPEPPHALISQWVVFFLYCTPRLA